MNQAFWTVTISSAICANCSNCKLGQRLELCVSCSIIQERVICDKFCFCFFDKHCCEDSSKTPQVPNCMKMFAYLECSFGISLLTFITRSVPLNFRIKFSQLDDLGLKTAERVPDFFSYFKVFDQYLFHRNTKLLTWCSGKCFYFYTKNINLQTRQ